MSKERMYTINDYLNDKKVITNTNNKTERSMISKDYANRFIREFIIERSSNGD